MTGTIRRPAGCVFSCTIAEAIAQEIGRAVDYRRVETDGARRAAERIAELIR